MQSVAETIASIWYANSHSLFQSEETPLTKAKIHLSLFKLMLCTCSSCLLPLALVAAAQVTADYHFRYV